MEKTFINDNSFNYDTLFEKARAIVINEKNKIYVCNMNGNYALPGGTVENNELPLDTLKRELKEELGIIECTPNYIVEIDYCHTDFPKYQSDLYENRLNRVFYYLVQINSNDLGNQTLTEYEKSQNIQIEECTIEEIREKIKIDINNKYSKFTNKELQVILDYIDKNKVI